MRGLTRSLGTVAISALVAGCGAAEPDAQLFSGLVAHGHHVGGSVEFRGAVGGTWNSTADPPAICESKVVQVTITGPTHGDTGTLLVDSTGFIYLDVEKYGDFQGTGGVLQPGRGFRVDADIATLAGKSTHVTGALTC